MDTTWIETAVPNKSTRICSELAQVDPAAMLRIGKKRQGLSKEDRRFLNIGERYTHVTTVISNFLSP